jgi:hypothetical protein
MGPGTSVLKVPETRVASITEIETQGPCDVYAPTESCDAGHCAEGDAGLEQLFQVVPRARGECSVVVRFSDGGEPLEQRFSFGGPLNSCCNQICPGTT